MGIKVARFVGTDYQSNGYVVYCEESKRSMVIDPNDGAALRAFVVAHDLKNDYIVLTHEHYDHVAALAEVKRHIGGEVIASETCDRKLDEVPKLLKRTYRLHMHFVGAEAKALPAFERVPVDRVFTDALCLQWCGRDIVLKATAGHSTGSICIYFVDEMLFSGDALSLGKTVVTKMLGGDREAYKRHSVAFFETLPKAIRVYPGHGPDFLLSEKTTFDAY